MGHDGLGHWNSGVARWLGGRVLALDGLVSNDRIAAIVLAVATAAMGSGAVVQFGDTNSEVDRLDCTVWAEQLTRSSEQWHEQLKECIRSCGH